MKQSQLQSTVQLSDPANILLMCVHSLPLPEQGSGCTHLDKHVVMGAGAAGWALPVSVFFTNVDQEKGWASCLLAGYRLFSFMLCKLVLPV